MVTNQPLAATSDRSIRPNLEGVRQELLDLGLRNTLLNYRLLKGRGVDVVDELPAEVFRILVNDGKNMSFEASCVDSDGDTGGFALAQPEDSASGDLAARHTDRMLQTNVSSSELQKRLLNPYNWARTSLEEQGVSALYLALGMLEWYEDQSSDIVRRAPLVLVPVELERSSARDRFHAFYTGEDIGENLSLTEKLSADFGLRPPSFPESDDIDVNDYLNQWKRTVAGQPRWRIDSSAIALGFFSFGKFLMYRDLDSNVWPEDTRPEEHPIVSSLLGDGFQSAVPTFADNAFIDQVIKHDEVHQIVDADSSQTLAILEAKEGRHLVIQGPPGTGKSQTITNIIAEAIGSGKTVLFVSEKMAALEVVKRRLDGVGIGDACLELHSHKTNKRNLLTELRRTLELGSPRVESLETEMQLLEDSRQRLNAYCTAVNLPIGETSTSPYRAFGNLLQLRCTAENIVWPDLTIKELATWSDVDFERRAAIVDELQARVGVMGSPREHPFFGVTRTVLFPSDKERIGRAIGLARSGLNTLRSLAADLAVQLGLSNPEKIKDCLQLSRTVRSLLDAPTERPGGLDSPAWSSDTKHIRDLIEAGRCFVSAHEKWDEVVIPGIWDQDLLPMRRDLAEFQGKWWRFLSGRYRSARSRLRGYCRTDPPADLDSQISMIDEIMEGSREAQMIEESDSLGSELFGVSWRGVISEWQALATQAEWALDLHQLVHESQLPTEIIPLFNKAIDYDELSRRAAALDESTSAFRESAAALVSLLQVDPARYGWDGDICALPLNEQHDLLETWNKHLHDIDQIVAFNMSAERCENDGIGAIVELATNWPQSGAHLGTAFRVARYKALIERAISNRSALREFDRAGHEQIIERFRQLDEVVLRYNRYRLALAHWDQLPRHQGGGQLATLRREFEKKSRHLPIRRLMEQCGNAIQAIKPVFMMSPMSIATYLPPGSVTFDLVVFDEASQVRPADAMGALLRGTQAIVVGDSKQLPPTSFFDTVTHSDEVDDEDPVTRDIESILGLFTAQNTLQRMLRWHYRSRHESLIAVSNYEFYENKLVVFPSPDASRQQLGLVFHHLAGTAYDRGGTRTNPEEARAVAQAVMAHARTQPERTLGVAAFSTAQAQAILDELERHRRVDRIAEPFFNSHDIEPFFVKNLENVQGDERDVIFISVGYGRDANGYLAMSFGPLNSDGGERRLNVLITRARQRCEIFTNLKADDIDLNRTQARGVVALKRYLKYAETGYLDIPAITGRSMDSPFEEAVFQALTRVGYRIEPQVGSAGFYIDLAVVDPDQPGRYLLGIECDGATYHSARSARDRDRLRQTVLEGLGWTIHRIWSTDWFSNQDRELRRVVEAIEHARASGKPDSTGPASGILETETIERDTTVARGSEINPGMPYQTADVKLRTGGLDLHEVPVGELARVVVNVVQVESPVHFEEVARRIMDSAGVGRLGRRIRASIEHAVGRAERQGVIFRRGDFLWRADMATPPLRDRSKESGFLRSIEAVAPEEIEAVVLRVVADGFGMSRDEISQAVGRFIGFQRVTANMRESTDAATDRLLARKLLGERGQFLTLANEPLQFD